MFVDKVIEKKVLVAGKGERGRIPGILTAWRRVMVRFELSRILGDAIINPSSNEEWLVASDYNSTRQKSQRAFAAELLCPIGSLDTFLDGDYSAENQEEAARHYNVSLQTINSLLVNNRLIGRDQLLQYE